LFCEVTSCGFCETSLIEHQAIFTVLNQIDPTALRQVTLVSAVAGISAISPAKCYPPEK
jgi:hypothetical protein